MILIADSGSTKTNWCVAEKGEKVKDIITKGINPYFQSEDEIVAGITDALLPHVDNLPIDSVFFYGAGCTPGKKDMIGRCIAACFNTAVIEVNSDLLAAAYGVCGKNAGIVCILGTGSNSCFYDGTKIVKNVPPLGFILGDEGGGAVLGKLLVGDILKNQLPSPIKEKFLRQIDMTTEEIINHVYQKPFPNRFLASISPFLLQNIEYPEIRNIVKKSFCDFFKRNVMQYDYQRYNVSFVGSTAFCYKEILEEVAKEFDVNTGKIIRQPMDGLINYHSTTNTPS